MTMKVISPGTVEIVSRPRLSGSEAALDALARAVKIRPELRVIDDAVVGRYRTVPAAAPAAAARPKAAPSQYDQQEPYQTPEEAKQSRETWTLMRDNSRQRILWDIEAVQRELDELAAAVKKLNDALDTRDKIQDAAGIGISLVGVALSFATLNPGPALVVAGIAGMGLDNWNEASRIGEHQPTGLADVGEAAFDGAGIGSDMAEAALVQGTPRAMVAQGIGRSASVVGVGFAAWEAYSTSSISIQSARGADTRQLQALDRQAGGLTNRNIVGDEAKAVQRQIPEVEKAQRELEAETKRLAFYEEMLATAGTTLSQRRR